MKRRTFLALLASFPLIGRWFTPASEEVPAEINDEVPAEINDEWPQGSGTVEYDFLSPMLINQANWVFLPWFGDSMFRVFGAEFQAMVERLERAVHKYSGGPDPELTQLLEEACCVLKRTYKDLLDSQRTAEIYRRQTPEGDAWERAHGP